MWVGGSLLLYFRRCTESIGHTGCILVASLRLYGQGFWSQGLPLRAYPLSKLSTQHGSLPFADVKRLPLVTPLVQTLPTVTDFARQMVLIARAMLFLR
jgi:hypothetical protein